MSFGSTDPDVEIFSVGDALGRRGWYLDRQGPPDSLHCTVNAVHSSVVDHFLHDLADSVAEARSRRLSGAAAAYGTVD
jgi:hypothetical protein